MGAAARQPHGNGRQTREREEKAESAMRVARKPKRLILDTGVNAWIFGDVGCFLDNTIPALKSVQITSNAMIRGGNLPIEGWFH